MFQTCGILFVVSLETNKKCSYNNFGSDKEKGTQMDKQMKREASMCQRSRFEDATETLVAKSTDH